MTPPAHDLNNTGRSFLKYTLLPGFLPRAQGLFQGMFSYVAFLLAIIYSAMRLLPPQHPYLNPANYGHFGVRHVVAEAANNLVLSRNNIDQIFLFFVTLSGLILLVLQFVLLIVSVISQPALAFIATEDLIGVNSRYNAGPAQDIAFVIMDRVFGLKNIFNSCISDLATICTDLQGNPLPTPSTYPFPFHIALHTMLKFYSYGIFFIAVIVILYFVVTIVAETASTGTPFGQRFNALWAPVRLLVFLALLVPLNAGQNNAGLNGAQIITFWAAKAGSNFATNGWGRFNETLTNGYLGETSDLIATPNIPEVGELVKYMFIAKTCKLAEEVTYGFSGEHGHSDGIRGYLVRTKLFSPGEESLSSPGPDAINFMTTGFEQAIRHSNFGNITIRFGSISEEKHANYKGYVKPYCGEITLNLQGVDEGGSAVAGSFAIQDLYYQMLQNMWKDPEITQQAACFVKNNLSYAPRPGNCPAEMNGDFAMSIITSYEEYLSTNLPDLIEQQVQNGNWSVNEQLRAKGWGGAAIWYNRVAQMNGDVTSAVLNIPQPDRYPYVMEYIANRHVMQNEEVNPDQLFDPSVGGDDTINYERARDAELASLYNKAFQFWQGDTFYASHYQQLSGNVVVDTINLVFGTKGLFDLRENADINPLAQISALGKSMMEAAIRNLAIGTVGGGVSYLLPGFIGEVAGTVSSFIQTMGTAMLAISFVLYYVLPFMPFIYFLFAVGGWVKSIFEAIVAMPLWALAHVLRIDGQGLPGQGAASGYFLIFEIFLRPILIIFGLLGSILIFSALVQVMNGFWDFIIINMTGHGIRNDTAIGPETIGLSRGPIDHFMLTGMYAVVVYMLGLACFKLIDSIPNTILRWMGSTVATFQEDAGDPAGDLSRRVFSSSQLMSGQLNSMLSGVGRKPGSDVALQASLLN